MWVTFSPQLIDTTVFESCSPGDSPSFILTLPWVSVLWSHLWTLVERDYFIY